MSVTRSCSEQHHHTGRFNIHSQFDHGLMLIGRGSPDRCDCETAAEHATSLKRQIKLLLG
eukprot:m.20663 g.20663  ORF g.20663 m.20663 type:complete len:60 (-) comp8937_c0_seq1:19-198(-)